MCAASIQTTADRLIRSSDAAAPAILNLTTRPKEPVINVYLVEGSTLIQFALGELLATIGGFCIAGRA